MDAASPQKHLKDYNFGTTNDMMIELTTIMYHHKTFNLGEDWSVTRGGVRERNGKTSQNEPENQLFGSISGHF